MGNANALIGTFAAHWRHSTRNWHGQGVIAIQIPTAVVLGWIASNSGDPTILAYVIVGAPMMLVWENSAFFVPLALFNDVLEGTAEMTMATRTPLSLVVLGKSLAVASLGAVSSVLTFVTVVGISGTIPEVDAVLPLLVSVAVVFLAIVAAGFLFAPAMILTGREPGMLFALAPLGTVVSGFLYPLSILPGWMEVAVRFAPTSWAMESVIFSVQGDATPGRIAAGWGAALAVSAAYVLIGHILFLRMERLVRAGGTLAPR